MARPTKEQLQDRIKSLEAVVAAGETAMAQAREGLVMFAEVLARREQNISRLTHELNAAHQEISSLRGIHGEVMRRAANALSDQAFILSAANPTSPLPMPGGSGLSGVSRAMTDHEAKSEAFVSARKGGVS